MAANCTVQTMTDLDDTPVDVLSLREQSVFVPQERGDVCHGSRWM